ncbi:MAG: carboxyl transferase [Lachnospiraceae bacterium]|nr:carboxyl transferase [Lachnospiraceae bacterium]
MSNTSQASARIHSLLDENSFVEIGAKVSARATDFNLNPKEAVSDGVVTGYGQIDGKLVYVYSQDPSVLGGSVGEMHAKKIVGLYKLAMKMGAPVIGLIDSSGLRLQEATDALNAFGQIYRAQALASGVIPQISAIFGSCGGGLALFPTLTDFTFMEKKAKLFVNSPNALDGNYEAKKNTASAEFQSKEAGVVDVVADEAEIYEKIRALITLLPSNNSDFGCDESTDDANRLVEDIAGCSEDPAALLSRLSDGYDFYELKADTAKEMVIGFLKLDGLTVGAIANRTALFDENGKAAEKFEPVLTANGCYKAADFVNFCNAFDIPVLTVTNVKGYEATVASERKIAIAVAKLTYALANADVPKINLITKEAYGSAYVAMNSKALGADLTFAWEGSSVGMMDAALAAKIMYAEEKPEVQKEKADAYQKLQVSIDSAAARGYVDTVIDPVQTRKYLIGATDMLYTKREARPEKKHGTV